MNIGFAIDDAQGLNDAEELRLVALASDLGYHSAWMPSRADGVGFDRCVRWHAASGLPVGISAVPASGRPAVFYAENAQRLWEVTQGRFTLVLGSGQAARPAEYMRAYFAEMRTMLPTAMPLYVAALGPRMLEVAGQLADGVAFNWCTAAQLGWSRERVFEAAVRSGRASPSTIEYIRTCVDPDADLARLAVAEAAKGYALGPPAYRRHFERMGFGDLLRRLESSPGTDDTSLSSVGAAGRPHAARHQFEELAVGLDVAIVRIVVVKSNPFDSARRALEECRPTQG